MAFAESEKAHIVAKYIETGFVTTTRRWVRKFMRRTPPTRNNILRCHEQIMSAGNMAHSGGNSRPRISDGEIENVRSLFKNNIRLSIRQAESLLNIPRSTIQRVLRKCSFCTRTRCKISTESPTQTREKEISLRVILKTNIRMCLCTYQR